MTCQMRVPNRCKTVIYLQCIFLSFISSHQSLEDLSSLLDHSLKWYQKQKQPSLSGTWSTYFLTWKHQQEWRYMQGVWSTDRQAWQVLKELILVDSTSTLLISQSRKEHLAQIQRLRENRLFTIFTVRLYNVHELRHSFILNQNLITVTGACKIQSKAFK